jgi:hypothetical protein
MAFQIFNDGACIRIENGTKTLLVTKEQVKTIDTIQNNIVRIDIGEGPLKNIFVNYQDVTAPAVASANELRDLIKGWMVSDNYSGGDATEVSQVNILNKLGDIALILQAIKLKEADLTQSEPSRIDESNPYMIYRGWHSKSGIPDVTEWAIERIRRENDEIIHEWAFGTQRQIYKWSDRTNHYYVPYDFIGFSEVPPPPPPPMEGPNPVVPDSNPPAPQQPME